MDSNNSHDVERAEGNPPAHNPDGSHRSRPNSISSSSASSSSSAASGSSSSSGASSSLPELGAVSTIHTARTARDLERHPTALSRIATQRSQHSATVGAGLRPRPSRKPLPAFGGGKPYPPVLPEKVPSLPPAPSPSILLTPKYSVLYLLMLDITIGGLRRRIRGGR